MKTILALLCFALTASGAPGGFGQNGCLLYGVGGWWTFNDGSGTLARDWSFNGNNGTLVGAPTWGTGIVGGGIVLGTSKYLNCGTNSPSLHSDSNLTICGWFKLATTSGNKYALSRRNLATAHDEYAVIHGFVAGKYEFYSETYSGSAPRTALVTSITDTLWHHIAWTYDGAKIVGYKDGAANVTNTVAFTLPAQSDTLILGNVDTSNGNWFGGSMDDVRFYVRALSAAEIQQLYNGGYGR